LIGQNGIPLVVLVHIPGRAPGDVDKELAIENDNKYSPCRCRHDCGFQWLDCIVRREHWPERDVVQNLAIVGIRKILLNFRDVDYIDSSGLGELVSAFTSIRSQGGVALVGKTRRAHS
jgi:STAS domain